MLGVLSTRPIDWQPLYTSILSSLGGSDEPCRRRSEVATDGMLMDVTKFAFNLKRTHGVQEEAYCSEDAWRLHHERSF